MKCEQSVFLEKLEKYFDMSSTDFFPSTLSVNLRKYRKSNVFMNFMCSRASWPIAFEIK